MDNKFNLIDESWIPIVDVGLVSLRDVFQNPGYRQLGGNPVEKMAVMKLLLAIGQAAATTADEIEWRDLGSEGLAKKCLDYMDIWHDRFYLYGDRPFLQMPDIHRAKTQPYSILTLGVATGNTTVLTHTQMQSEVSDPKMAMGLVAQMSMALGGKKTDNKITLSIGYQGKVKPAGKPGPAIGYKGYLHSLLIGESLQETLWLNLQTSQRIDQTNMFPCGVGVAPWESMPQGEDCLVARALRDSLMGRLVPLCRFCLLTEKGLHYSEGLAHAGYKEGVVDPTVSVSNAGKEPKVLWANPEKRPWRELTSLLSFLDQTSSAGVQNLQIRTGLERLEYLEGNFGVWSGGLRVTSQAGEQYASGSDDFVESVVWLDKQSIGDIWFMQLKSEMDDLSSLAKGLYGRVTGFFKEMNGIGEHQAARATNQFWQLCEREFQALVFSCQPGEEEAQQRITIRRRCAAYVHSAYDQTCAKETGKQIDAWAKHRPNLAKYLRQES